MIQFRFGVFETNSPSTHTLQIVTADLYKKLESGELLLQRWSERMVTLDEAIEESVKEHNEWYPEDPVTVETVKGYSRHELMEFIWQEGEGFETLEHFFDDEYLEGFEYEHTTEHGDSIVVFGKYGRDG